MAQDPIPIRISATGQIEKDPVLDKKVVKVKKSKNENVKWVAQDRGGPWTIKFDKGGSAGATYPVAPGINPFSVNTSETYLVPRAGEIETQPVKGNANTTYRYTVYDDKGKPTDDPDVDVE
jgi:hypothetical protein